MIAICNRIGAASAALTAVALALLAAALGPCCSAAAAAAAMPSAVPTASSAAVRPTTDAARQPWIVVWRKGVNGSRMFDMLCPSLSLPSDAPAALGPFPAAPTLGPDSAFEAIWESGMPLPVLPCLAKFDTLLNGFSGGWAAPRTRHDGHAQCADGALARTAHRACWRHNRQSTYTSMRMHVASIRAPTHATTIVPT